MEHLVPGALMLFLLTIAFGRVWARHSIALLSVEEKARALDLSLRGHAWPFVSLAVAVAITVWMPGGWVPAAFWPGYVGLCFAVPFFVSVGAGLGHSLRLSRAGLPHAYRRSVRFQAIAFHVALLVLVGAIIYSVHSLATQRSGG